jgi:4-hydroxy-2-oxoheptanedioate aldolase
MSLVQNRFKQALKTGEKQIGLWVSLSNPYAAEIVAASGYDWVVLDMEHAPSELTSVLGQLQVFAAYPATTALVRPDWNDPVKVKRLLDMGAPGLVFPMVQSVAEAELAVSATRYPPHGIRGVAGSIRANKFGRIVDYYDRVVEETAVIVQVETRKALDCAEAIGAVKGVDGVFFGPADIAADMGYLGKHMSTEVWDVIRPVAARLIAQGVPVGTLVTDPVFAAQLLDEGFTFVACGIDTGLLAKGADALLAQVRNRGA